MFAAPDDMSSSERPSAAASVRPGRVSSFDKMYIWSIVLEPMLFFVLFQRTVTGVSGNLSRLLQFAVIIGLVLRLVFGGASAPGRIRFVRLGRPLYTNYRTYFLITLVAGLVGAASGAYALPAYAASGASAISVFLNSASTRPIFEYCIAAYYFVYFVVLPQFFLKSKGHIDYFFSTFRVMFLLSLMLGFIDLLLSAVGVPFIPRMLDERIFVGVRFHGLAGEPRDAFVFLFFGLAMLHLRAHYRGERLKRPLSVALVVAALLTQSTSGMIGIGVFVCLYGIYTVREISTRRVIYLAVVSILASVLIFESAARSPRVMLYVSSISGLWRILESGGVIPQIIMVQMDNIYPLYDLTIKARDFNWLPIMIGSGFGSASAVNNRFAVEGLAMANPHSQLVRTLYESGLIGMVFLVRTFVDPVKHLTRSLSKERRHEFLLLTLLLLGCFLGHRSSAPFILLGVLIAVFRRVPEGSLARLSGRRTTVPAAVSSPSAA